MKIYQLFFIPLILLLASCGGGSSGANGNNPFPGNNNNSVFTLDLTALNANCQATNDASFTAGDTICIQARLLENGNAASGQVINFTAALGTLSQASKLTDNNGISEIRISSDSSNIGAATLTATHNDLSTTLNYEFLSASTTSSQPRIQISLIKNGQSVSRFKAGEDVQLQANLVDGSNNPLSNNIVTFAAAAGNLATTTALTNSGIAQVALTATNADIGAAIASVQTTIDGITYSNSMNYEIQSSNAVDQDNIQFGHFNASGQFVANQLGVSVQDAQGNVTISAGATLGLSAALVDAQGNRLIAPTPITFTSNCVANNLASIDTQVTTINGEALSTYQDMRCAGNSGNTDQIVASVVIGNSTLTLNRQINIQAEDIGSISFISADPTNIVLAGTGGQNNQSVSTVTFQVNGALGNPLSQQEVDFSLNTTTGGLTLSPAKGLTNSQGQVSTRITAGNVPTAVRVTAVTRNNSGTEIQTQSDLLSVNTGLPDQNSFTFSASVPNPEAFNINGQEVTLSVRLADSFNNPVPNGTTVNFTTEGGVVDPSCTTQNGNCTVTWRSANPKPSNHRVTILATAIGHETLFDLNGNNVYDNTDGGPISDPNRTESGFGNVQFGQNGFHDMSEAWRDDDEDSVRDNAEIFIDYNNDGTFNSADALFNGPQCASGSACGQGVNNSIHVRKSIVLIMSSSSAEIDVLESGLLRYSNYQNTTNPVLSIARGGFRTFTVNYSDTADQTLANGTTIQVTASSGDLAGTTSRTVGLNTRAGKSSLSFTLANNIPTGTDGTTSTVTVLITSPSGATSTVIYTVNLP